jgi:hypothetical protein
MLLIVVSDLFIPRKKKVIFVSIHLHIAVGQGIYFATQANISLGYTHPDANRLRHMFMGKNTNF